MKRVYYELKELPDIRFPEYISKGIQSYTDCISANEKFLRQLHTLGTIQKNTSFHLLYLFSDELKIYFYIAAEDEKELETICNMAENSHIFSVFNLQRCCEEPCSEISFKEMSFLKKRLMTRNIISMHQIELDNSIFNQTEEAVMEWQSDDLIKWSTILEYPQKLLSLCKSSSCIAIRLDIIPNLCENWFSDIESTVSDLKKRTSHYTSSNDNGSVSELQKLIQKFSEMLVSFPVFGMNLSVMSSENTISESLCNFIGSQICKNNAFEVQNYQLEEDISDICFHDTKIIENVKKETTSVSIMKNYSCIFSTKELSNIFICPILVPECHLRFKKEGYIPAVPEEKAKIHIGYAQDGEPFDVPLENLSRHVFMCGMTGSGKTRCMFQLISELKKSGIPFLILEPVKKEYRSLLKFLGKDMLFFAPGSQTQFDIHINPLEFPENVTLSKHIDNLVQVFRGTFLIPTPGPSMLTDAIERTYRSKGWFPGIRNTPKNHEKYHLSYPTMADLYKNIILEIQNSGYRDEFVKDMTSILHNRIESFMKRNIGQIYNCGHSSVSPSEWIEHSILLELNELTEADANFMSLLLSVYIRETLDEQSDRQGKLRHVIFYEEAHNLIGVDNVVHSDDPSENPNPKIAAGKFIEKMLVESRALGEGIVIADQIPSHMPDTVIKNTDLKLIFRLISSEDKNIVSGSISADAQQNEQMTHLEPAHAITFYQKMKKPQQVIVEKWNDDQFETFTTNQELTEYYYDTKWYTTLHRINMKILGEYASKKLKALRDIVSVKNQDDNNFRIAISSSWNYYRIDFENIKISADDSIFERYATTDGFIESYINAFREELNKLPGYSQYVKITFIKIICELFSILPSYETDIDIDIRKKFDKLLVMDKYIKGLQHLYDFDMPTEKQDREEYDKLKKQINSCILNYWFHIVKRNYDDPQNYPSKAYIDIREKYNNLLKPCLKESYQKGYYTYSIKYFLIMMESIENIPAEETERIKNVLADIRNYLNDYEITDENIENDIKKLESKL